MANKLLQPQRQLRFDRVRGNSDSPSPNKRGRYRERYTKRSFPNYILQTMRDAGVRQHHTLCIQCGKPATQTHRENWRECNGACPINQAHEHPCQPCPDLMRIANEDWCVSRVNESLAPEREAARNLDAQRHTEQQPERRGDEAPNWQTSGSPQYYPNNREGFGESSGGFREPGYDVGYANNSYGSRFGRISEASYSLRGGYADHRTTFDSDRYPTYTGSRRIRDDRERSPRRERSPYYGGYRDRTPVHARSTSYVASPSRPAPGRRRRSDRSPPSMVSIATRSAEIRSDRAVSVNQQDNLMLDQETQPLTQSHTYSLLQSQSRPQADTLQESLRSLRIWRRDEAKRQQQVHKHRLVEPQRNLTQQGSRPVTATVATCAHTEAVNISTLGANMALSQPQGDTNPDGALQISDVVAARNAARQRNAQIDGPLP